MARIIYCNLLPIYSETILGCQVQVQRGARFAVFGGKKERTLSIGNLYTLANQVYHLPGQDSKDATDTAK
jgi:hypothetical protein